jgi:hypothetical protein
LRVIKEGLGPDDRVIVNGLMRARPGQKVKPEVAGAKPSAAAPANPAPVKSAPAKSAPAKSAPAKTTPAKPK